MRAWLLALALVIPSASALAANNPAPNQTAYYHVCSNADLVGGTWKMMKMTETPPRKEAEAYQHVPYHYLSFYPNSMYSFVAINLEIMQAIKLQQAMLWPEKQKRVLRYTLDDKGVLNLYIDNKVTYSYRCLAIASAYGGYIKGDLVLTGYTEKGKTVLYKWYRRWF